MNDGGRIGERLYAVGGRGAGRAGRSAPIAPTDTKSPTDCRGNAAGSSQDREGGKGLMRLLDSRDVMATDYDDWRKIEETETANARPGSPREKFVRPDDWLQCVGR